MKCLAKKTQYQKAENALTTEYGMWLLEYVDVAFGVTLAENYGFREKRLQRFYDGNRNGLCEMVNANMPTAMFVDKGKGRRKGDSSDLIDDGVDTTEYMIKRELRNIGFSDCDFEALSPENRYNESERHTQLDVMSHNVRTAWYEANARRAVRLYAAYTLLYMHDTYNLRRGEIKPPVRARSPSDKVLRRTILNRQPPRRQRAAQGIGRDARQT